MPSNAFAKRQLHQANATSSFNHRHSSCLITVLWESKFTDTARLFPSRLRYVIIDTKGTIFICTLVVYIFNTWNKIHWFNGINNVKIKWARNNGLIERFLMKRDYLTSLGSIDTLLTKLISKQEAHTIWPLDSLNRISCLVTSSNSIENHK